MLRISDPSPVSIVPALSRPRLPVAVIISLPLPVNSLPKPERLLFSMPMLPPVAVMISFPSLVSIVPMFEMPMLPAVTVIESFLCSD